jgi:hypothetical protein
MREDCVQKVNDRVVLVISVLLSGSIFYRRTAILLDEDFYSTGSWRVDRGDLGAPPTTLVTRVAVRHRITANNTPTSVEKCRKLSWMKKVK